MRGQQQLFTTLFSTKNETNTRKPALQTESTKTRNVELTYRYYYFIEIQRDRYDDVLGFLRVEFHISEDVVVKSLGNEYELLKQLIDEKPNLNKLKKLYPHKVWKPRER